MWRWLTVVLGLLLAALAVPAVRHLREAPPPPAPVVRSSLTAPIDAELGAGDETLDAAISNDGAQIAFVATSDGRVQLWRRRFAEPRAEALAGTDGAAMPAWKRDDQVISFFANGELNEIAVGDGTIRRLAAAPRPAGASWQADGSLLFVPDSSGPVKLLRGNALSDATRLLPGDTGHAFPVALEDGGFVYLALRENGSRVIRLAGGGDDVELTPASGHGTVAGGALLWVRDGVLLAQRIDLEQRRLVGRSAALVPRVGVSPIGRGFFAAGTQLLAAAAGAAVPRDLAWFAADGTRLRPILEPGEYWQVRLPPDDSRIAVTALDPLLRTLDVFAAALDNPGNAARVSLSLGADRDPAWSPDGTRLAYRSATRGTSQTLIRQLGSTPAPEVPLAGAQPNDAISDWRGTRMLLDAGSPATGLDIWLFDTVRGSRTQITRGGFNESNAVWSPDGRYIAYVSDESGQPEIYVQTWPDAGGRVRVSFGGGTRPQWGRDARTLFFMRDSRIMRTAATARDGRLAFDTPETAAAIPGLIDFAAAHRSDRFAAIVRGSGTRSAAAEIVSGWQSLVPAPAP